MRRIFFISMIIVFTGLISCKKNNTTTNTETCTGASASCKFDGATLTASALNNTLIKDRYDAASGGAAKRLDIRIGDGTKIIILTLSDHRDGITGDGVRLDTWYTNFDDWVCDANNICLGALITVTNSTSTQVLYSSNADYDGEVKITSVDAANKKISGTFSGTVGDFLTEETVEITNGIFTNACYSITTID